MPRTLKRVFFSVTVVFSLLVFSCELFNRDFNYVPGERVQFWAYNFFEERDYSLHARLLIEGLYCNVWAELGSGVTIETAQRVADAFDNDIYEQMIDAFSIKNFNFDGRVFPNIMSFASWLVNGDGKLCILLLDIKDSYQRGENETFVGGYFWEGDLRRDVRNSNNRAMIYIDTNPGRPGIEEHNVTLAHEMQHMMNYVTSIVTRREGEGSFNGMDLWINEGLSAAAEWVYLRKHSDRTLSWLNRDPTGLIALGNNFFIWGNRVDEHQNAVLDDYVTVYLFFQWIRLQSNDDDIYRNIIASPHYDYRALTSVFADTSDWETLIRDWLAANYIKSSTGRHGYRNDSDLNSINVHYAPEGLQSINLYPGEGVYSKTPVQMALPSPGVNIRYAGLGTILSNSVPADGALLTYNRNSNIRGTAETGTITGIAASVNAVHSGRFTAEPLYGPFPIGAGDMLRLNGRERSLPYTDFSGFLKGHEKDE